MNRLRVSDCMGCPESYEEFTYNEDGNITSIIGRSDWSYMFVGGSNRLAGIYVSGTLDDVFNFEYDVRGNTTRIENMTDTTATLNFRYNYQNLPIQIVRDGTDTLRYRYDENGLRVSREIPGETPEYFLRDHTGRELAIYDYVEDRTKKINIFGNGLEASVTVTWFGGGGTWSNTDDKYYYVKDHLGSIRGTIDETGELISARYYYPFGETLRSTTLGNVNDQYQFTEKERDQETNLDYFGARYYGAVIGRWLTPDPLADQYPGWSPYNYVSGNPLRFIDPDGMAAQDTVVTPPPDEASSTTTVIPPPVVPKPIIDQVRLIGSRIASWKLLILTMPFTLSGEPYRLPAEGTEADANQAKPKSLDDPESLEGSTPEEVKTLIPEGWVEQPTRTGDGVRISNPDRPGEQVRIMPGNPSDPDPKKRGPYVRVSKDGKKSPPIPLSGNPN